VITLDQIESQIILAVGRQRIKIGDLKNHVKAANQTVWDRVERLIAAGYLSSEKGGFPPIRWLELTSQGLTEFRKLKTISNYQVIFELGAALKKEIAGVPQGGEICKELIRAYPDSSWLAESPTVEYLIETGEWMKVGDALEKLKANIHTWQDVRGDYRLFLDAALEEDWYFSIKYQRWSGVLKKFQGDPADPMRDPSLQYYQGSPAESLTAMLRAEVRGNLDVLQHMQERLHSALRIADLYQVKTLAPALDLLDLVKANERSKSIVESTRDLLIEVLKLIY